MRAGSTILLVALAGALVACGGDDEDDEQAGTGPEVPVVTQTQPTQTATTPTATTATATTPTTPTTTEKAAPSPQNPSGETANLPLCSEVKVRPCRTKKGAVLEKGGANAGEIADLPKCSETGGGPAPCRLPDGSVREPENL